MNALHNVKAVTVRLLGRHLSLWLIVVAFSLIVWPASAQGPDEWPPDAQSTTGSAPPPGIERGELIMPEPEVSLLVEEYLTLECTAGVADGDVTFDGRPLLWKLRNESDATNDVHYFASGMEHYPGLGPATYSYLGMGPANDYPEGPVRQGLNSQGLAVGWNVLDSSGWQELHHQALGHYDTVSQVRTYVNGMTNLSTYNYFIDTGGEAALWENQTGMGKHWEYNTRAKARDSQWIDADNADGDDDYSTGVDVTLSGWVVRANTPAHFNTDGTDDLWNTGRYQVGRDITGDLIYNSDHGSALSAKSLASSFFRDDTLARDDTVSNMIIHGVLPTEDPRLSTMWTLLGHSETGIFVPVWIHGVESGGANKVPRYLDSGDDGVSVYAAAKGMHNAGFNEANVQARTLPFEEHLFDVVNNKLLPDWRARDWTNPAAVTDIGEEMKRVQEQMDTDAFKHLKYLRDNGSASNYAPTVSVDSAAYNGLEVTLSVTAFDAENGSDLAYLYNYGDGQIGSSQTHEYAQSGHYLVSCTVTDENGVSQTDWLFVTVTPTPETPTPTPETPTPTPETPTPTPETPTPTPETPTPTPLTMHVGDLDGVGQPVRSKWEATVTITVHDQGHNPLVNAVVAGTWNIGPKAEAECTTDGSGQCSVVKGNLKFDVSSVSFTVDSVTLTGYSYVPDDVNHDPDGDSDGTSITVGKPQ